MRGVFEDARALGGRSPNVSDTPETDAIVSRFRKGQTSSDGLILTMQKIERERDELRRQVQAECSSWNTLTNELSESRLENQFLRREISALRRELEELRRK